MAEWYVPLLIASVIAFLMPCVGRRINIPEMVVLSSIVFRYSYVDRRGEDPEEEHVFELVRSSAKTVEGDIVPEALGEGMDWWSTVTERPISRPPPVGEHPTTHLGGGI